MCSEFHPVGHLQVGDQILMVDGTNFVEISQREATQALHEAMQWETVSETNNTCYKRELGFICLELQLHLFQTLPIAPNNGPYLHVKMNSVGACKEENVVLRC